MKVLCIYKLVFVFIFMLVVQESISSEDPPPITQENNLENKANPTSESGTDQTQNEPLHDKTIKKEEEDAPIEESTLNPPPTIVEVPLDNSTFSSSSSSKNLSTLLSDENEAAANDSDIVLYVGESESVPIPEGANPFVSNDELLSLTISPSGTSVKLTALRGGKSELLYYENGLLQTLVVAILFPEIFIISTFGPKFKPELIYFIYTFSNTFRFTEDDFYIGSSYSHSLSAYSPLGKGRFSQQLVFVHHDLDDWEFRQATASYKDRNTIVKLGNDFTTLNLLVDSVLTGRSHFGATASIRNFLVGRNQRNKYFELLTVFAGIDPPSNIFQLNVEKQIYGFNYSFQEAFQSTLFPDLLNAVFLLYQPIALSEFHTAGWIEGNYHFSSHLSLGVSGYVGHGGFALIAMPFYEDDAGTLFLEYRFVDSGLEQISGGFFEDTLHEINADLQRYLDSNLRHILNISSSYSLFIPPDQNTQSTNFITSTLNYIYRPSFRNSYGLSYAFNRINTIQGIFLFNSIAASLGYALSPISFLSHSIRYGRQDITNPTQQVVGTTSFSVENANHRFLASTQVTWDKDSITGSEYGIEVAFRNDFVFRKGQFSFELNYQKERFSDDFHQLILEPSLDYFVTSVIRFTISSNTTFSFGNPELLNANVFAQLQIFFGPGVEPGEPLFESLFGGGKGHQISGNVFLDHNYNALYDDTFDSPISRAAVLLNNSNRSITDEEGMYAFLKVPEGMNRLSVLRPSLPPDLELDGMEEASIYVSKDKRKPNIINFPFTERKATIRVRLLIDVNENQQVDALDNPLQLRTVYLTHESGNTRKASANTGGAIFHGVDYGRVSVEVDLSDVPDSIDIPSRLSQVVSVKDYEEYEVVFLFEPIRQVRGQIRVLGSRNPLPSKLKIQLGESTSTVDNQGYYWLKDVPPGQFELSVLNLPDTFCITIPMTLEVVIPEGPLTLEQDITLSTSCNTEDQNDTEAKPENNEHDNSTNKDSESNSDKKKKKRRLLFRAWQFGL